MSFPTPIGNPGVICIEVNLNLSSKKAISRSSVYKNLFTDQPWIPAFARMTFFYYEKKLLGEIEEKRKTHICLGADGRGD